jgi:hypothetical protein
MEGNTRTFLTFTDDEVTKVFGACGFSHTDAVREFFWPMVAHRLLRQRFASQMLEAPCRALGLTAWFGSPVVALFTRNGRR